MYSFWILKYKITVEQSYVEYSCKARTLHFILKFDNTVNVVILDGGNFAKMLARHFTWALFSRTTPISFIKAYEFIFAWGNFREEDQSVKNAKITRTRNFQRLKYIFLAYILQREF